jgi:histidyl-tRNA synthetase
MSEPLSTQSYKGVRDFYPAEMAVQRYIFDMWSETAQRFGFERYDASVLEPAALYKAKGAENAEMVNDQTYTFTDRGDREVTLRPEMTPTVARMIAGKRRELSYPVRWYSIPNLFRYERAQRGRLREHWQLNADIFGSNHFTTDVEVIQLAHQIFLDFGATENMFEILINNRATMQHAYAALGITEADTVTAITRLNDRKDKIDDEAYVAALHEIVHDDELAATIKAMIESKDPGDNLVVATLNDLGIDNVRIDRSLARGFDYYTGTIFEIKDTHPDNNRSLLGGGRYDNLTGLFGGDPISGIGFGFGDVTMKDFLLTHDLMPTSVSYTSATIALLPMSAAENLAALKIAQEVRATGLSCSVDNSERKIGKKIGAAAEANVIYVITIGEDEVTSGTYTMKHLESGNETSGTLSELTSHLIEQC